MITFITRNVGPGYLELNKSFKAYQLKHVSHEKKVQNSLFVFEKTFCCESKAQALIPINYAELRI